LRVATLQLAGAPSGNAACRSARASRAPRKSGASDRTAVGVSVGTAVGWRVGASDGVPVGALVAIGTTSAKIAGQLRRRTG
jgi:hypothetical protein